MELTAMKKWFKYLDSRLNKKNLNKKTSKI